MVSAHLKEEKIRTKESLESSNTLIRKHIDKTPQRAETVPVNDTEAWTGVYQHKWELLLVELLWSIYIPCILIHVRVCLQTLCPWKHTSCNQEEKKKNSTITSFLLKKLQKRAGLSGVCTTSLFSPNPLYSSCLFPSASLLQNSPISLCSLQAALENKGHQKDYHNSERKAQSQWHINLQVS